MKRQTACVLLCATLLPGCYTVQHDYAGPLEITPGTHLSQESTSLGMVRSKKKATFLFWGIVDLSTASAPDSLEAAAKSQYGADIDGVVRVKIHEEENALDVVVGVLTLGIYSMITVESEGEAHRFTVGAGGTR